MATLPLATILIVAPPTLQRQGLLATLRDALPDSLLSATADVRTLPDRLRREAPALIILDAMLPDPPLDEVIEQVRIIRPGQRILVLGGKRLPFRVSRLIVEMGGGMLLARRASPEDLIAAVARLLDDEGPGRFEEPTITYGRGQEPQAPCVPLLTRRELEVLRLVVDEMGNTEIAERLSLSVRTVESHRRTLLQKTGTRSFVGLALLAVRQGWLEVAR